MEPSQVNDDGSSSPNKNGIYQAQSKNPENKSREQLRALAQRCRAMRDESLRMTAELDTLYPRRKRLREAILFRQTSYTRYLTRLPKTGVLNELSASKLRSLNKVMRHDNILGELMCELYQIQKQMRVYCDTLEETMNVQEEHFVTHKQQEDVWRRLRIAIAAELHSSRVTSWPWRYPYNITCTVLPLASKITSPQDYALDDTNDLPGSGDTSLGNPTTSPAGPSEGAAQETIPADSLPPIKDSENKTPEEIATILRQWSEVEDRYDQTKPEGDEQYFSKCARLFGEYSRHQIQHAMRVALLPSTIDYSQLSTVQLDILTQAMSYDQRAGMANWALYEVQKKAMKCCNAFEEMVTFCLEHFILCEAQEQELRDETISLALSRRYLREMGPRIVMTREHIMNLVKGRR